MHLVLPGRVFIVEPEVFWFEDHHPPSSVWPSHCVCVCVCARLWDIWLSGAFLTMCSCSESHLCLMHYPSSPSAIWSGLWFVCVRASVHAPMCVSSYLSSHDALLFTSFFLYAAWIKDCSRPLQQQLQTSASHASRLLCWRRVVMLHIIVKVIIVQKPVW